MKYVILRVVCKFSDGSLRIIKYDENKLIIELNQEKEMEIEIEIIV